MLDRKKGPTLNQIKSVVFPEYHYKTLDNGVRLFKIVGGLQNVLKVDIVHRAGRITEDKPIVSRATASLLKDGTKKRSSSEIAEEIDFYGASIKTGSNLDFVYTTVFMLSKHAQDILPIIFDIYQNPTFSPEELQKFKKLNIEKLKEELTKVDVLSYRNLTEIIFGQNHPYGYNSSESDYNLLASADLKDHFDHYYGADNCWILLSGQVSDVVEKMIISHFGNEKKISKPKQFILPNTTLQVPRKEYFTKNQYQSSIKIGKRLFDKTHADHAAFFVLNTIYGGYFGSRLMTSIREEMGLTYDIYSMVDQMLYDGCFYVSTETNPESVPKAIDEIYHQMDVLKQEKIKPKELTMVKNYLMGSFLSMLDGPFNTTSTARAMILQDKKPEDFIQFVDAVQYVTPQTLQEMAQKYFVKETMIEVIVSPE